MEKTSPSENNRRIAKNTLFLYFRSILTIGIGFYTSREVLLQLGVSDFGVYNVVGGIIILFSFIQNAMGNATSRFFTFDLGLGDFEKLKKTFSLSVVIHIIVAAVILILGETVGLWLLNTVLVIPADRVNAAKFVYQFTVFSACVASLQVPYVAAITAHERMKVFAYMGLADAALKLTVALAIGCSPFDKLKVYSVLLFLVYVIVALCYAVYCIRSFPETRFKWLWDKKMFIERIGFSGWTTVSGVATVTAQQSVNMLLNMFHGVIANAAYGIMTQVCNAVTQFSANLVTAFSPQVTKSYANGNIEYMHSLIFRFSRISFLLLALLIIPAVMNMDFVLHLWLKEVPDFAVVFCQIRLANLLFEYPHTILCVPAIFATGKIKNFVIANSILAIMYFALCYVCFKLGFSPIIVPIAYLIIGIAQVIATNLFARRLFGLSIRKFCKKVVAGQVAIALISFPLPIWMCFKIANPTAQFFATSLLFLLLFVPCAYLLGLEKGERDLLKNKIRGAFAK